MSDIYEYLVQRAMRPDPLGDLQEAGQRANDEMQRRLQSLLMAGREMPPEPPAVNMLAPDMLSVWRQAAQPNRLKLLSNAPDPQLGRMPLVGALRSRAFADPYAD